MYEETASFELFNVHKVSFDGYWLVWFDSLKFFVSFYQVDTLFVQSAVLTVTLEKLHLLLQKQPARRLWDAAGGTKKRKGSCWYSC